VQLVQECIKSCDMKRRWEGSYIAFRYCGHNDINNNSNNNNISDTYKRLFIIMIPQGLLKEPGVA